ncbi:hypothetical protein CRUP_024894 [Coryphaenoides rupestris]|nr:hypothetical protein CRUP_024894 [Coryphaenoides rupestris]
METRRAVLGPAVLRPAGQVGARPLRGGRWRQSAAAAAAAAGVHQLHHRASDQNKSQKKKKMAAHFRLDERTAHSSLDLFKKDTGVIYRMLGLDPSHVQDDPERFRNWARGAGSEQITAGRHYWEVTVKRSREFRRKWSAMTANKLVPVPLVGKPDRVGVLLDYEAGVLALVDTERRTIVHSLRGASGARCAPRRLLQLFGSGALGRRCSAYALSTPAGPRPRRSAQTHAVVHSRVPHGCAEHTPSLDLFKKDTGVIYRMLGLDPSHVQDDPERFRNWAVVLGSEQITAGRHYWEVTVKRSREFRVGVAEAGMPREDCVGTSAASWVFAYGQRKWSAMTANKLVPVPLVGKPDRVGVLLDYEAGVLALVDTERRTIVHSLRGRFRGPLCPAFGLWDGELLTHTGLEEPESLFRLDERTAHSSLDLFKKDTGVIYRMLGLDPSHVQDDPERFRNWAVVLGSEQITAGRHYWEVTVKRSREFRVGVAEAGMPREDCVGTSAASWVFAYGQRKWSAMTANKLVPVPLVGKPDRVGVLLDYEAGVLALVDTERRTIVHSLRGRFRGPLCPAFGLWDGELLTHTGLEEPESLV